MVDVLLHTGARPVASSGNHWFQFSNNRGHGDIRQLQSEFLSPSLSILVQLAIHHFSWLLLITMIVGKNHE